MFPLRDINPTRTRPIITLALIVANLVVFFGWQPSAFWVPVGDAAAAEAAGAAQGEFLFANAAIPCEVLRGEPVDIREASLGECSATPGPAVFPEKQIYGSVLVSLFLHGSLLHIASNMWFLWIFGNNVEEAFGTIRYLAFYLLGGVVATLVFVGLQAEQAVPLVGASGAIAAVLGGYLALFPGRQVIGLIGIWPIPVPAILFLGLWFIGQFATQDAGIAWEAHAAGFAFGFLATLPIRQPLRARLRRLHA